MRYNVVYAEDWPSGSGSVLHEAAHAGVKFPIKKVEIIVHIDNIPTIIHWAFVDQLYNEWGLNIAYAACARIAAGLIYKLPSKKVGLPGLLM